MRWELLIGAVLLDGALLMVREPTPLTVHPIAPPLTRIAALGDAPLGVAGPPSRGLVRMAVERTVQTVGSAEQKAALRFAPPNAATLQQSRLLRLSIEADAVRLANVLGPERVGVIVAQKENLSEWYGEGRMWSER